MQKTFLSAEWRNLLMADGSAIKVMKGARLLGAV
jgi:hypothetical protein